MCSARVIAGSLRPVHLNLKFFPSTPFKWLRDNLFRSWVLAILQHTGYIVMALFVERDFEEFGDFKSEQIQIFLPLILEQILHRIWPQSKC
jgi:hypothetical protein